MRALSHPNGLYVLFFTEMWERFSYYGMRALLVLYLVHALHYAREDALSVYAAYTGLVYLTPIAGGWLADRYLGQRRAILAGAIVMALGHFAMAFPPLLYPALGLLVVGNGFFKPNISTLVGSLYAQGDPRRDGGFTLFYMGINLGAFLAPLVCGTLGAEYGWHYGFAAAGVGMLAGLAVFALGQARLGGAGFAPGRAHPPGRLTATDWYFAAALSLSSVVVVFAFLRAWPSLDAAWAASAPWARALAGLALVVAGALTVRRGLPALDRGERQRVGATLVMALFVIFFWMGFEQAGGTMNLFADKLTDRRLGGFEIPASYFQAVNPLAIIVLAPPLSWLWLRWDRSRLALSTVSKQAVGLLLLGVAFAVLAVADRRAHALGPVSPAWLVAVYVLQTAGELFLSPTGLSMVTKLAPAGLVSLMMGLWFTALAAASYLAGNLENLLRGTGVPLYPFLVVTSVAAGTGLLLLRPWLLRWMQGRA